MTVSCGRSSGRLLSTATRRPHGYVDCDAHVYECDATWDHLDPNERHFRPVTVRNPDTGTESWLVSDQRMARNDRRLAADHDKFDRIYPPGARDLTDVPARLAHMDRLGIDVQVLFSTFFNQASAADRSSRPRWPGAGTAGWRSARPTAAGGSGGRCGPPSR